MTSWGLLKYVINSEKFLFIIITFVLLISGLVETVGLLFIAPIVDIITLAGDGDSSPISNSVINILSSIGLPTDLWFLFLMYINQKIESGFTAIIPSARNNSYYKEVGTLRHKFYFEGLQATSAEMKLPTDISHYFDTLYTTTDRTESIINQGNWRWSTIASANWTTWIDHSNQSTEKAHTYSLTWS